MLDMFKKNKTTAGSNFSDDILESEKYYQEGIAQLNDLIAPSAIKIAPRYIRVGKP